MAEYIPGGTQRDTIRKATESARKWAAETGEVWTERVLLWSGDTLAITATAAGRLARKTTAGWDRDGLLWCSSRIYNRAL